MPLRYASTKTYGHNLGLSCCFRQHRAESHCRLLHGYALAVRLEFEADSLDDRNWVIDFGALKPVKDWLCATFDHKLLVAVDDPELHTLLALDEAGLADVLVVQATGCEAFAEMIAQHVKQWLCENSHAPRVRLSSVEVREHSANSALFRETAP